LENGLVGGSGNWGLQKEFAVTRNNLQAQQQTLELTRDRLKAGLATELDVTRAKAQVATTASQIPTLPAGCAAAALASAKQSFRFSSSETLMHFAFATKESSLTSLNRAEAVVE
jgi:hypothetical protein